MKLAFCLFNYFPYGGLQRDFSRIAQECLQRGHEVQVYTMAWEGRASPDLPVTIVPVKGTSNHRRCRSFVKVLPKYLQTEKPDLVIGFNKMPGLDVYYAADPCYAARADAESKRWYKLTPRYKTYSRLERAVFDPSANTQILLLSPREEERFIRYYATQRERFHLLPPGIARDRHAPPSTKKIRAQLHQELQLADDANIVLMIGSSFKTKGVDRALSALASLQAEIRQKTYLLIIGQGDQEPFLKLAKRLGIEGQVRFLGGRDDVPRFLWSADLLLHPSYVENTGTVLLEALVAGLPVLTTEVCGFASYIEEALAGIVVPSPFQQTVLNHQLAVMLNSPTKRHAWHDNAVAFAAINDLYSLPERAVDFIERLINEN